MEQRARVICTAALVLGVAIGSRLYAQQQAQAMPATEEARRGYVQAGRRHRAGHAEEAFQMFSELVHTYPKDNWAGCALGQMSEMRWRQGKCAEAIELSQRVIRDYPEARYGPEQSVAGPCAYLIALCHVKMGDKDRAMAAFEEACRKYPDARAGDTGKRLADIFPLMMQAEELNKRGSMPGSPEAGKLFTEALRHRGRGDMAAYEEALRLLIDTHPKDNWAGCALGHLGTLKRKEEQYDEAIAAYRRVLQEFALARYGNGKRVAPFAAYSIAICYHKSGRENAAMEAFDEAVEKYPDACTGDDTTGTPYRDIFLSMIRHPKPQ